MINPNSLNRVVALDQFSTLTEDELMKIEGGGKANDLAKAGVTGAALGGTIGSIVPGLGTGLGFILGAKVGVALYGIARYGF
jgi:bacteriocin-like protein